MEAQGTVLCVAGLIYRFARLRQTGTAMGDKISFGTAMKMSGSKLLLYAFAAYAWGNTIYSAICGDPVKRAEERGYTLE